MHTILYTCTVCASTPKNLSRTPPQKPSVNGPFLPPYDANKAVFYPAAAAADECPALMRTMVFRLSRPPYNVYIVVLVYIIYYYHSSRCACGQWFV